MADVHTGGCLCKGVRYEFSTAPLMTVSCYCRGCQHVIGSPFTTVSATPLLRGVSFVNFGRAVVFPPWQAVKELAKVSHLKNEYKNAKLEAPPVRLVNDRNDLISFFRCFWYSTSKRFWDCLFFFKHTNRWYSWRGPWFFCTGIFFTDYSWQQTPQLPST